jgi:hypothetical protein
MVFSLRPDCANTRRYWGSVGRRDCPGLLALVLTYSLSPFRVGARSCT